MFLFKFAPAGHQHNIFLRCFSCSCSWKSVICLLLMSSLQECNQSIQRDFIWSMCCVKLCLWATIMLMDFFVVVHKWAISSAKNRAKTVIFHFLCCMSLSLIQQRLYYMKVRDIFVLILAQPISHFVPGATSVWLTPSALSRLTITRSTPPFTATEPTGATGTFTASSTWPCSVRCL